MIVSQCWQHAGKHLEAQVILVAESVGAALDDADLVVESFDETQGDFVVGMAVRGDAVPVTFNHLSELLVGFQALPFECVAPVLEETSRPTFTLIAPQLAEGLLEQISGIQSLVGGEEPLQGGSTIERQILPPREQRVFWPLM